MENVLISIEYGQVLFAIFVYALVIAAYWKIMISCERQQGGWHS